MGFGKTPGNLFRWRIRERASTFDLTRRTGDQVGRFGERPTDGSESTTAVNSVDIWVFMPDSAPADTPFGDRLEGDMGGLALPDADVQYADRLTHGGETYEVSTDPLGVPSDVDPEYIMFGLEKVTN